MRYKLWFYAYDKQTGEFAKQYYVFTGTRYQCYKVRASKSFSWQYKVIKSTW